MEEKKLLKRLERAKGSGKLDDLEISYRRLAEFYSSHGQHNKALASYKDELSVCTVKNDPSGAANAHRMIGETYTELGEFPESIEHVTRYLVFARSSKNSVEQQRALATIGRTYFCWASALKASFSQKDLADASVKLRECRKAWMKSLQLCEEEIKCISPRERQEMKARLLLNLGLACEIEDDIGKGVEFLQRSVSICRKENLFEDLHKCYSSLASMLMKRGDNSSALATIDNACEIAEKCGTPNEALVSSLLIKATMYFTMRNYIGARAILRRAYKLKSPNDQDRQNVENSLKAAVYICDLEAQLSLADEKDFLKRKALFEKLGDACCYVENYKHAIEFYKNMTECALSLGQSGKELQPCYVSLYKTYQDDKNYDSALEYARKEFELSKDIPMEAIKSHLVIGDILERSNANYSEVSNEYMAARRLAEENGDTKLLTAALSKLISVQKNDGRFDLAQSTEKCLESLGYVDSQDSESEDEVLPATIDGVHLSDLSDSDEELSRARPSRSKFKLTRNEKGETPLHVAAIKGDVARVKSLMACGHPVKERDKAGWTPLHEAANYGYVDIVKILLQAGADINDPGGKECKGVTPLHDAASNGHLEVIKVLLENKACVTVITDDGETPLDCIRHWRDRVDDLVEGELALYESIVHDLESRLKAAGFQSTRNNRENEKLNRREGSKLSEKRKTNCEYFNLRRDSDCGERGRRAWGSVSPEWQGSRTGSPLLDTRELIEVADSTTSSQPLPEHNQTPRKPVADYRAAIDAIRKRPPPPSQPVVSALKPALLAEGSYIDEWLEDDLRLNRAQKKRKINDYVERNSIRKSLDDNRRESEDFPDFFFPLDDPVDFTSVEKQTRKKPKLQTTLLSAGFKSLTPTEASEESLRPISPQPRDNSDDFPSLPSPPFSSVSDHQQVLTKVRVNVGKFTLLIPLDSSKVNELSVKWLAEEAGRRYSELEGAEPQLQLKTRDGAMIAATDPVGVILGEDLDTIIVGWKTASLTQRYRDALNQEQSTTATSAYGSYIRGPDTAVMERLAACDLSKWLDLSYMSLTGNELNPILRALRHERGLRVLDLAGNILADAGLDNLTQCLEHCSLEELNLRCNNITATGFKGFVSNLPKMSANFLTSLRTLDLSFNPIGEIETDTMNTLRSILPNLSQIKTEFSLIDD